MSSSMRVHFLGGADEVGASCTLLEVAGRRVLVDAGVRISPKTRLGLAGDQLPDLSVIDRAGGLDVILLTHAHTDHTGALPLVLERYGCPVLATPVTAELTRVLLGDARRIMQGRLEQDGELPLFDAVAVEQLLAAFHPVPFATRVPLADGLVATFYPAGHIAGAAMIGIESEEGRILFSGDISISPQRTVDACRVPPFRPDALVLESTYGGRLHANRAVEEARLVATIAEVVAGGGKVLIPAFALGRAQEVLLVLHAFRQRGLLPDVPVWVDGMVRAMCGAYSRFPEALPLALRERIEAGRDPFGDEQTRFVQNAAQRNAVAWSPGPAIIVSSSGMLTGGPSPQYARVLARDPASAILLTGYQDEESPGRRLQAIAERGEGQLQLGQERVKVLCRIATYALSAHADEGQLVNLAEALDPREVFLVHGDGDARASIAGRLRARQRVVREPRAGQSFELHYRARPVAASHGGIGRNQPLNVARLWAVLDRSGGGYFTAPELAHAWWGDRDRADDVAAALAADDGHFVPDGHREGLYRAQSAAHVQTSARRRAAAAALADAAGHLLLVRPLEGSPVPALCMAVAREHLAVRLAAGLEPGAEPEPLWPEAVIEDLGPAEALPDEAELAALAEAIDPDAVVALLTPDAPRALDALEAAADGRGLLAGIPNRAKRRLALCQALLTAGAEPADGGWSLPRPTPPARMEPNQALAVARATFGADARLRKAGYRLDDGVLALAFDFPDAVLAAAADRITALSAETGWQVEVAPEANHMALAAAVREVLPPGWCVVKAPSIHREDKRVAAACQGDRVERAAVQAAFAALTGYALEVTMVDSPRDAGAAGPIATGPDGAPMEINAAYAAIRQALSGTPLYRASLKDGRIVLSFISPEVGKRYQEALEDLSGRVGWPLAINATPNQGEIMTIARSLLAEAGLAPLRGPGLYAASAEVRVGVAVPAPADDPARTALADAFLERTGYRLVLEPVAVAVPAQAGAARPGLPGAVGPAPAIVQIPLRRIQLTDRQRAQALDAEKTRRAVERARRQGGAIEPIVVRRLRDGYRLVDGLRRVQVAEALGLEDVPAVVEE